MRILHTSDWHLGQHFMGKTRQAEHQALIGWLLDQVVEHAVDVVIIAGDVFDSGTPPSYARELYNGFVVGLHDTGAKLVVLGGNHDSVATLGESQYLLARLGAQVIPGVAEALERQLLVLPQRDGAPGALLCAIPFIRPRDVLHSEAGQSAEVKQLSLQEAIQTHYRALFALTEAKRDALGQPLPIIATGHLTTVGASASESVREIYVGALEAFPTNAFPPADYIALGHIHRPQRVGGHEHIRYCGSPLPLSFDEATQQKEVLLVDLDAGGLRAVTPLPVPRFQPLQALRGNLQQLATAIPAAATAGTAQLPVWLEITVQEDDYLSDLQPRVQALAAGLPVEVLRIKRERGEAAAQLQAADNETLDELTPYQVFGKRLAQEALADDLSAQLTRRFRQVVEQIETGAA